MRSRSIKVEINREITKFPNFKLQFKWTTYFKKKKKHSYQRFFITNDHLRLLILILVKNAFCKCFLELKSTIWSFSSKLYYLFTYRNK